MDRKSRGARRGRADAGSGWLATLAGAVLLMAAGFGVGLVAGAAFEEPELVMDHLRGRSRPEPLAEAGAPGSSPDLAGTDPAGSSPGLGSADPADSTPGLGSADPADSTPGRGSAAAGGSTPGRDSADAGSTPGRDIAASAPAPAASGTPAAAAPVASPPPPRSAPSPAAPKAAPLQGGFSVQVGAFAERGAASSLVGELRQLGFAAGVFEGEGRAPFKVRVGPVPSKAEAERLADVLKRKHRLPTWVVSLESR